MRNSLIETPGKNAFFRARHEFRPIVSIVDIDVGTEKHFVAVTDEMVRALAGIGITVTSSILADESWSAEAPTDLHQERRQVGQIILAMRRAATVHQTHGQGSAIWRLSSGQPAAVDVAVIVIGTTRSPTLAMACSPTPRGPSDSSQPERRTDHG